MSRHHILKGLSKTFPVLWVSPPQYWRGTIARTERSVATGVTHVSDSFWTYVPTIPADYARSYNRERLLALPFRIYHALWRHLTIATIKHTLHAMGIQRVILYIWRPEYNWAVGRFDARLVCYHIVDEYSFDPNKDHGISSEERKLLEGSDLIFIHSKTLFAKKGHINPNTFEVPNGVDFEYYRNALKDNPPTPDDLACITHPRIGYMGHIKRHIDLTLLYDIAIAKPEWSLVLIGPLRKEHEDIQEDVNRLLTLPNVYFLGGKPSTELPRYINGFDVCLMPYRKTNYTKYIYPLKMHEYFACGKPVVATELENLKEFSFAINFAESVDGWVSTIEKALEKSSNQEKMKLINIACLNSWDERVQRIHEHFSRCLPVQKSFLGK
jgi:glycosyltransferase involved in cell wall biosynthesis